MHRAFVVVAMFAAMPAFALNNRSAVSSTGLDTNPCTVTSPCRSFNAAIAQTQSGGEIIALDSAGYGPFTIGIAITVSGAPGVHAAITATSGAGITINAANTDSVTIRNLVLIGIGADDGINNAQSAELVVIGCTLRGFNTNGVLHRTGRLTVDNCVIQQTVDAIDFTSTTNTMTGVIINTLIVDYWNAVVLNGAASATVKNCVLNGGHVGVVALSITGSGTVNATAFVEGCVIAYHTTAAVAAEAAGGNNTAFVYLGQNDISFAPAATQVLGAGTVYTFGNNRFVAVPSVSGLIGVAQQ